MMYDAHENPSMESDISDIKERLLHIARAGNSVLEFVSDEEQKLKKEVKLADVEIARKFEESLKLKSSGGRLESVKKAIKESLDPLTEAEGLSPLLKISREKGNILFHGLQIVREKLNVQVAAIFLIDKSGMLQRFSISGVDKYGKQVEHDWYEEESYSVDAKSLVGRTAIPEEGTGYGRFQFTRDLEAEYNLDQHSKDKYFEKFGKLGKTIAVPINGRNRTYGVLRIINTVDPKSNKLIEDSEFKEIDLVWLSFLATYIANALSNFRRDLKTDILEYLNYRLANPFSSVDGYHGKIIGYYQEVLDLLVMNSETAFKAGVIRLLDDDSNTLRVIATSIFSDDFDRDDKPRKVGEGLAGSVVESRKRLILTDISEDQFHNKNWIRRNSFKTFSCFPLISRGNVFGTLSLYTGYKYDYHADSINFLQGVTESVATYSLLEFSGNKQRLRDLFNVCESMRIQRKVSSPSRKDVEEEIVDFLIRKSYGSNGESYEYVNNLSDLEPPDGEFLIAREKQIYRFALPKHSTHEQRRNFENNINMLRGRDSEWDVFRDWEKSGEEQAFICLRKGDNGIHHYSAYIVSKSLSKVFQDISSGRNV